MLVNPQEGQASIKPERQEEFETGIDFSVLHDRLGFSLTWYDKIIDDFLMQANTPASSVHVVDPDSIPNPGWLHPGIPSAGQQLYGDALLSGHKIVAIPSAVSTHSWNLIFHSVGATGSYKLRSQERFVLDTRLHPPA